MKRKSRFLIIEDNPVLLEGIYSILQKQYPYCEFSITDDPSMAYNFLDHEIIDLILFDINCNQGINSIDWIKYLARQYRIIPILVFSSDDDNVYVERSIRAGAKGYITKHEFIEHIGSAIYKVLNGQMYLSVDRSLTMLNTILYKVNGKNHSFVDRLSDRELEVFMLIGKGYKNKDIAGILNIHSKTVETYRSRIKEKMNLNTSGELAQLAIKWVHC